MQIPSQQAWSRAAPAFLTSSLRKDDASDLRFTLRISGGYYFGELKFFELMNQSKTRQNKTYCPIVFIFIPQPFLNKWLTVAFNLCVILVVTIVL